LSTKRTCHLALGLMLGLWGSGCREANPAYRGPAGLRDAAVRHDAPVGGHDDVAAQPDAPTPGPDGKRDAIPDGSPDGKPDASVDLAVDAASDVADVREPTDAVFADIQDARDARPSDEPSTKDFGSEPILKDGPDVLPSDAVDVPMMEIGPDGMPEIDVSAEAGASIDADMDVGELCPEPAVLSCVSADNPLIGACKTGVTTCSGGAWSTCSDVKPVPETCNGIDDDCNGMIDEGCTEGCIVVCQGCSGVDASTAGMYATIEAAIASAGQTSGAARTRICVASTSCSDPTVYESAGALTVPDGFSIQGNYAMTADGLTYCGVGSQPNTTIKFTGRDQGVTFGQNVVGGAELSGFVVKRASEDAAAPGPAAASIAGVVINGAKNVSLGRIFMTDEPTGGTTYGVSVTSGGQATIVASAITGGQGRTTAIGINVNGGSLYLHGSCDKFAFGHCASSCDDSGALLGIRGRTSKLDTAGESSAVSITNSGSLTSNLVNSLICAGYSNFGDATAGARVAAVRCDGPGCAKISGNAIAGGTDQESLGLAISNADPSVESNRIEGGCGSRETTGVLLDGSSARLRNNLVFGGHCSALSTSNSARLFYGLHVLSSTSTSAPDVHSNDIEPLGIASGESPSCQSVGVFVERSGASAVAGGRLRNNIVAAGLCNQRFAIRESGNGGLASLENNDLYGPAGASESASAVVLYRHGGNDLTTLSAVNTEATGGSGNISADPAYASGSDLHLTSSSPCVDKGLAAGAPANDYDRVGRPQGAGPDIGAYELVK